MGFEVVKDLPFTNHSTLASAILNPVAMRLIVVFRVASFGVSSNAYDAPLAADFCDDAEAGPVGFSEEQETKSNNGMIIEIVLFMITNFNAEIASRFLCTTFILNVIMKGEFN